MDKHPLLGLLILLCWLRGESLRPTAAPSSLTSVFLFSYEAMEVIQCRMCHLQFPGENCSRGRGICTATTDEACTVGRMFKKNGKPWLTFMGCLKNCANVENIKWSTYLVNFRCCRSYDLCNENI
uniref:Prostate and testis expressed 1 n=1 Tax=Marmota marmota marmota TaxID=9994 RepID=A0A8C6EMS0_MARMA